MEDNNKNANQAFLQKFKGRTNRIDRKGLNHALEPINMPSPPKQDRQLPTKRKRLVSLDRSVSPQDLKNSKVDLDKIIPSNPQKQSYISVRSGANRITPKKQEYMPSLYDPDKTMSMASPNTPSAGLHLPPSRSVSEKSQNLHRRVFGKYLKLDDEAKRHLQFLQNINKNRVKEKHNSFAQ